MIHDAVVEVTCNRERCSESVFVKLEWKYRNMSDLSGFYDSNDAAIEDTLVADHDWVVRNGEHFCTPECAELVAKDLAEEHHC